MTANIRHAWIRKIESAVKPEGQTANPASEGHAGELCEAAGLRHRRLGKWVWVFPVRRETRQAGLDRFLVQVPATGRTQSIRLLFGTTSQGCAPLEYPGAFADATENCRRALTERCTEIQTLCGNDYARINQQQPCASFAKTASGAYLFITHNGAAPAAGGPDISWRNTAVSGGRTLRGGKRISAARLARALYAGDTRLTRDCKTTWRSSKDLASTRNHLFFSQDTAPLQPPWSTERFFESDGALRGRKGPLYEGGPTCVPLFAVERAHKPGTVWIGHRLRDWIPQFAELAGTKGAGKKRGWYVLCPQGLARQRPAFSTAKIPGLWRQQSCIDDWKGIRQNLNPQGRNSNAPPNLQVQLYNLRNDPGESSDVSGNYPDMVRKIVRTMREQHKRSELFPFAALDNQ